MWHLLQNLLLENQIRLLEILDFEMSLVCLKNRFANRPYFFFHIGRSWDLLSLKPLPNTKNCIIPKRLTAGLTFMSLLVFLEKLVPGQVSAYKTTA